MISRSVTLLAISLIFIIGGIWWLDTLKAKPLGGVTPLTKDDEGYLTAPELNDLDSWINSEPLTMEELKGKVVLIDFWTYSCINCIRTLPYLKAWHETYADDGLVIIGVHAPEFAFEKKLENVQRAIDRYNLTYPIVQDNDFILWRKYQNRYWPRKYLIDINGRIRYDHAGEGAYDETEKVIRTLLAERNELDAQLAEPTDITPVSHRSIRTPEIYFGSKFFRGNIETLQAGTNDYDLPLKYESNTAYLGGTWKTTADYSELISDEGTIVLRYKARVVNIVAGNTGEVSVLLNGELAGDAAGYDIEDNVLSVDEEKLFNIIDDESYAEKTLTLNIEGKGFRMYTFTFG